VQHLRPHFVFFSSQILILFVSIKLWDIPQQSIQTSSCKIFLRNLLRFFLFVFHLQCIQKSCFPRYPPGQVTWFTRSTVASVQTKSWFAWKTTIITSCFQQHFEITFEKTNWNTPSKITVSFFPLTKYSYITVTLQNPPVTVFSGAAAQLGRLIVEISRSYIIIHTLDSTHLKEW